MRSREFIKEAGKAGLGRIIIQKYNDAKEGLVYILKGPNGEVTNPAGQTLTYPTHDAAREARKNMADPSATQGYIDAEKKAPNAMAAGEAGKLGSGSFVAKMPWKTDPRTGQVVQQIKDAEGKVITKTYKNWTEYAKQTGVYPNGGWRPGYVLAASKLFSTNIPVVKDFFTLGDLTLFGQIAWQWHSDLNAIREAYTRGNYWQENKKEAEANMQEVNQIYLEKLAKAVTISLTTNIAGGAYLLTNKAVNSVGAGKMVSGSTVGDSLGSALASLFKTAGKTVNPETLKTLSTGGLEAVKLFTANWAANTDFKENIENAVIVNIIKYSELFSDFGAWVLTILPKVGNLDLSVGSLGPADDATMRKNAADRGLPATPGAPPPGTPEKSMGDKIVDKVLGN